MEPARESSFGWTFCAQSCLLALLTAAAISGQITPASGPEIQVAASATFQTSPAAASDAAGDSSVVVWQKQVGDGGDIYARRYTTTGGTLVPGAEFRVNTLTTGCQQLPAVAADTATAGRAASWPAAFREPRPSTAPATRRSTAAPGRPSSATPRWRPTPSATWW